MSHRTAASSFWFTCLCKLAIWIEAYDTFQSPKVTVVRDRCVGACYRLFADVASDRDMLSYWQAEDGILAGQREDEAPDAIRELGLLLELELLVCLRQEHSRWVMWAERCVCGWLVCWQTFVFVTHFEHAGKVLEPARARY